MTPSQHALRRPPPFSADAIKPFFDDRHRELAKEVATIAHEIATKPHEAVSVTRFMGERGLYAHVVARPQTGREADVDVRALVTIREALGYAHPLADAIFAVQGLASYPISLLGTEAQRARYAEAVVRGDRVGGFALTEPNAGSDVASLETRATRDGDSWVIEGEKTLISNVGIADFFVVFARAIDPSANLAADKSITAFIVDTSIAGVTTSPLPMSSPHPLGAIHFGGARVADSARLGAIGKGMGVALKTLDAFRTSVGAAANGMATRALDESIDRVTTRRQFGGPLSERETVRGYIAEMALELDASRLLVARAAHARDTETRRVGLEVAMAKLYSTEAAQRVIDKAVQLHGGSGVLTGTVVEALYRDIRPLRIYEGTSEIQRLIIARAVLDAHAASPPT